METYWENFSEIKKELNKTRQFMIETIEDADAIIKNPIMDMILSGGKMLRPALVILGAKFGRYKSQRIIPVAASVELLHIATLIHDDIIDESKLRRGVESVQSKYSKDVAVLIGDYLFAKTFDILAGDYPAEMTKNLSMSIMKICQGELSQYSYRYSDSMDYDKYIEIIGGKTAALFSMSLFCGAYEGKVNEETAQNLVKIGYSMGMMFQIVDDCFDYNSPSAVVGKSVINDIKQGYITLPLFYALKNDETQKLHELVFKHELNQETIEEIQRLVRDLKGLSQAQETAQQYYRDAMVTVKRLKQCKTKRVLEHIIESLIKRTY